MPFPWFVAVLCRWMHREQNDLIAFLHAENRVLKAQLRGRRLRLSDDERRRLAATGHRLGRRVLRDVATIVPRDTILRWHRELVVRQGTYAGRRTGRPRVHAQIRSLTVRMATEDATWGYTRIQGALKNLGYQVGRSTIARILKEYGVPPSGQRPMAWRRFVRAHWPALIDVFGTELSTFRAFVTSCAAFIIGLCSRSVYGVGATSRTNEQLLVHRMRQFTIGVDGLFGRPQPFRSRSQVPYCGSRARANEGPSDPRGQVRDVWGQVRLVEALAVSERRAHRSGASSSTDTHGLGRAHSHRTEPASRRMVSRFYSAAA
jgi:putative transposase